MGLKDLLVLDPVVLDAIDVAVLGDALVDLRRDRRKNRRHAAQSAQ